MGLIFLALAFSSSFLGWYGYKKWQYRVGTPDMKKSKERGVFIKELHFEIDSFAGKIDDFHAYIEKGFRCGQQSEDETVLLTNTNYPYQVSFGYKRGTNFGILLKPGQEKKFDSCNSTQVFLRYPNLRDTIIVDVFGVAKDEVTMKIWQ